MLIPISINELAQWIQLSILYLRCSFRDVDRYQHHLGPSFNSLFEMPYETEDYNLAEQIHLSILYLRCDCIATAI